MDQTRKRRGKGGGEKDEGEKRERGGEGERKGGRKEGGKKGGNPLIQLLRIPIQISISLQIMICQIQPVTKSVYEVLNNKSPIGKIIGSKLDWRNAIGYNSKLNVDGSIPKFSPSSSS